MEIIMKKAGGRNEIAIIYRPLTVIDQEGECHMKNHKFWAWAMIVCLFMTVYTGYEHK